jgi:predicted small metal-binding protein
MQATDKAVRCDCGHEVRAGSEEQLVAEVQDHAREAHGIEFSREDALLVVLRTELHDATPSYPNTDQRGPSR